MLVNSNTSASDWVIEKYLIQRQKEVVTIIVCSVFSEANLICQTSLLINGTVCVSVTYEMPGQADRKRNGKCKVTATMFNISGYVSRYQFVDNNTN